MTDKRGRIVDFYKEKCVFLTGASGYLGVVLLEILLRCCPEIQRIYILLREKKGVPPESRKEEIFKKPIFSKLKENQSDVLNKVYIIPGDTSLPNLGISHENLRLLTEHVSVVFHLAASISFFKPLRYMIEHNSKAVDSIINICKKFKKMEVLVITSTAYSNCNRKEKIEENIYKLPISSDRFLDALNDENDENLNYLVSQCVPKWPNHYTFSKCLAENILLEKASGIPTVIIRPSIVVNCWKGTCPGYVQEGSGLVDLGLAIGKGFVRVVQGNPNISLDLIPVDVTANAHVVAACKMVFERSSSPMVVNCTSGDQTNFTLRNFTDSLMEMSRKCPLPKSFRKPKIIWQSNLIMYLLILVYEHYVPAYVIDTLLRITGQKPRLVQMYRFYDTSMSSCQFFITKEWKFHTENFKSLAQLHPDDQEIFYTDVKGFDAESIAEVLPKGAPFYQWESDTKNRSARKRVTQAMTMLTTFIKGAVLACIFSMAYVIVEIAGNGIII